MRRSVFLAVASILLGVGLAQAEEPRDDHDHHNRDRERLVCRLRSVDLAKPGVGVPLPVPGPRKGVPLLCTVIARIDRHKDEDHHGMTIMNEDHHDGNFFRNRLAVACDGALIYDDGAIHARADGFEFLSALLGRDITLKTFERFRDRDHHDGDHHDDDRDEDRLLAAWLNIDGRILEGFCAKEVDDEDHDHDHHGPSLK